MPDRIMNVTVLGLGTLGSQIAFHAAFRRLHVTGYDVDEAALVKSRRRLDALPAAYLQDRVPRATEATMGAARAALELTTSLNDAIRHADLIIEAAPEIVDVKRELLRTASRIARPDAIIATNSSYMLPSALAEVVHLPHRFLALHFANRIWRYNTAEVMPTPTTDPRSVELLRQYAEATGMLPVVMKREKSGYVLNSMFAPLMGAAVELLLGDYADAETIDATWRTATGSPYGPFEMYDIVGLRQAYNVARMSDKPGSEAWANYLQDTYLQHGKTGVESGSGFYEYPGCVLPRSTTR